MLSIAFGLVLYHIMMSILAVFSLLLAIMTLSACLCNVINGHGFWYNFCEVWAGLTNIFRYLTGKRNDTR